jgi:hypothetical protein
MLDASLSFVRTEGIGQDRTKIPVSILTGFLGSGKTTAPNRLLRDPRFAREGGAALKPEVRRGWRTYNFEVERLHTYVAGGVRVHNRSENLEAYAALMDYARSRGLGYRGMAAEYGRDVARATARGMDPHLVLALRDLGRPDRGSAPEATPLQQVLGLSGDIRAPKPGPTPLRQVLGLDPIGR